MSTVLLLVYVYCPLLVYVYCPPTSPCVGLMSSLAERLLMQAYCQAVMFRFVRVHCGPSLCDVCINFSASLIPGVWSPGSEVWICLWIGSLISPYLHLLNDTWANTLEEPTPKRFKYGGGSAQRRLNYEHYTRYLIKRPNCIFNCQYSILNYQYNIFNY